MNTTLTIIAWIFLGTSFVVGLVSFIKDGGIKELIRLAKDEEA